MSTPKKRWAESVVLLRLAVGFFDRPPRGHRAGYLGACCRACTKHSRILLTSRSNHRRRFRSFMLVGHSRLSSERRHYRACDVDVARHADSNLAALCTLGVAVGQLSKGPSNASPSANQSSYAVASQIFLYFFFPASMQHSAFSPCLAASASLRTATPALHLLLPLSC